jgi:hypothetical protein
MRASRPACCGLAAAALMRVYRSPATGKPVSRAGSPYAIFWTVIMIIVRTAGLAARASRLPSPDLATAGQSGR